MDRASRDQRYYEIEDFSKADVKFRDEWYSVFIDMSWAVSSVDIF